MTFQPLDRDLDDDELVELERFLASSALVETSMDLYGVDGYFAAILIGPRTPMPSGWVAWVWDSERGDLLVRRVPDRTRPRYRRGSLDAYRFEETEFSIRGALR